VLLDKYSACQHHSKIPGFIALAARTIVTKVNWLIGLALLLISVVMLRLVFSGVVLPERSMVKWSKTDDPQATGQKLAQFLYPFFKEQGPICLINSQSIATSLVDELAAESQRLGFNDLRVSLVPAEVVSPCFLIEVKSLSQDREILVQECGRGDSSACTGLRALKKLMQKEPQPGQSWFSLYRTEKGQAVLFLMDF
jgi:hypothetical protein